MNQIYNVGIYCRLSVGDASNSAKAKNYIPADESVSIENQRELLSKFTRLNGWVETRTYIDDGYSGGNFQRPGFLEMLEDARKGVINLILVKDLSRLGRDYVEVGRYADIVFPSLGCRLVSVLDCLDSEGDNTDMLHFRSLMNDYHLRDLSDKIKSILLSKKKVGQCLSFKAPYGYRKSETNKYQLVIDEYSADIVRKIFDMRKSGIAVYRITTWLNNEKILPPMAYWYQQNGKPPNRGSSTWCTEVVASILRNEVYLGNLLMNRLGARSYKDGTMVKKPSSEWIRFEGAHDAIVTQETWKAVQEINEAAAQRCKKKRTGTSYLFSGKLVCADCHGPLAPTTQSTHSKPGCVKEYASYYCRRHLSSGHTICSWHRISERVLTQIVLDEIKRQAHAVVLDESVVVGRLKREIAGYDERRLSVVKEEIRALRRRVQELETMIAKLYEDKYSGAIDENTFAVLVQKSEMERLTKTERLDALLSEAHAAEQKISAIQNWTTIVRKYLNLQELNRTVVDELIDHIEIGESTVVDGQRKRDVKVFYNFVGLVD